ncbi:hypothetical protein N0V88_001815 [Collariella sp. IMI 366227]|nr:hypothetical protein N0V88_001815 [Collariella sp. IMI 366227]
MPSHYQAPNRIMKSCQVPPGEITEHLDGATLDYRALQADGRNSDQWTPVMVPAGDIHECYEVRTYSEPENPGLHTSLSYEQNPQTGPGSPLLGDQGGSSSAYNLTSQSDIQWPHSASPQYIPAEAYHATPASAVMAHPDAMAYQMVPTMAHGYAQSVVTGPPQAMAVYQAMPSPTAMPAQYPYGTTIGGSSSSRMEKEGPPVVVDGSGGRFKKDRVTLVVDGSSAKEKDKKKGHRSSKH